MCKIFPGYHLTNLLVGISLQSLVIRTQICFLSLFGQDFTYSFWQFFDACKRDDNTPSIDGCAGNTLRLEQVGFCLSHTQPASILSWFQKELLPYFKNNMPVYAPHFGTTISYRFGVYNPMRGYILLVLTIINTLFPLDKRPISRYVDLILNYPSGQVINSSSFWSILCQIRAHRGKQVRILELSNG
jgi:hypothetical protein